MSSKHPLHKAGIDIWTRRKIFMLFISRSQSGEIWGFFRHLNSSKYRMVFVKTEYTYKNSINSSLWIYCHCWDNKAVVYRKKNEYIWYLIFWRMNVVAISSYCPFLKLSHFSFMFIKKTTAFDCEILYFVDVRKTNIK